MVQGIGSDGIFRWNDDFDGGGGFSDASGASEWSQNSESLKRDIGSSSAHEHNISEAANKRLKEVPIDSNEKVSSLHSYHFIFYDEFNIYFFLFFQDSHAWILNLDIFMTLIGFVVGFILD